MSTAIDDAQQKTADAAVQFAKSNRKAIGKRLADVSCFPPEERPVAVLMAGSPGAGKTEASIELIASLGGQVLRIDPDELRYELPGYTGDNAHLFQRAVSILVDRLLDTAFEQSQSFILDGTLTHLEIAKKNIERALCKKRVVQILYVYQDPLQAWVFVQAREQKEGRRILPETFVSQYFGARAVVNSLKKVYGASIRIDLLLKNMDGTNRSYMANVEQIDSYISEKYDELTLRSRLGL